jgi:hypothetical protein
MAAAGEKKAMIVLRSFDGEEFEIEEDVAIQSQTIQHMMEDGCADNGIPLPNVDSRTLSIASTTSRRQVPRRRLLTTTRERKSRHGTPSSWRSTKPPSSTSSWLRTTSTSRDSWT